MTGGLLEIPASSCMRTPIPRTLIADDQPDVLAALRLLLRTEGYQIEAVSSPAAVLEAIRKRSFDVVLMDLNYARDTTSGQEGLDLITNIRTLDSTLPVVVLTAWGSVELAVEAMHRGVRDFVQKPWDNSQLLRSLRTQIEVGRKGRQQRKLDAANKSATDHLRQELNESQEIQEALLPRELPAIPGVDVAVAWKPAEAVGGDYFDVIKFSDRHTAICVADVAGKGLPAALMMSNMQAVLKSCASEVVAPADLFSRVNSVICHNLVSHRFISGFYALIDTRLRRLSYSNAGHCPPMLFRNGNCIRLREGGPVLGIFPDRIYSQDEIDLEHGDCLVLYTDGVTEALNNEGEEFGEQRLQELLSLGYGLHATELRDRVMSAVNDFTGGRTQDDATLMVLTLD